MTDWKKRILKADTVHKQPIILELCKGKSVLDVGCVGQDLDPSSDSWLHARIKKTAARTVGCDINLEGIKQLNALGMNIITPEQLTEKGELFDVIVMGDVIEHVNDPGAFLQFYSSFLNENGTIIVCTPNSFGIRYVLQVLFYGKPSTNSEHTLFLDPFVMLEMIQRIQLRPVDFKWLYEYQKPKNIKQRIIYAMSACWIAIRRYFRPNFMMVLEKIPNA